HDGVQVAFTTRQGGVSEGPYASLNLGAATKDDPERVFENRRRVVAQVDGDAATAAMAFQVHGAVVVKPEPVGVDHPVERPRCDDDVVRGRRLDLWTAAERALAGAASVERTDLCTSCHPELFFSHRRDRGVTGRQGVVARVVG